jgi:hypothetical protein
MKRSCVAEPFRRLAASVTGPLWAGTRTTSRIGDRSGPWPAGAACTESAPNDPRPERRRPIAPNGGNEVTRQ